jgi:hypothetical protein
MLKFDTQDTVKSMLDNMKTSQDAEAFFTYVSDMFPKPELSKQNIEAARKIFRFSGKYNEVSAFDFINNEEVTDDVWPVVLARNVLRVCEERKIDPIGIPSGSGFSKFHDKWSGLIFECVSTQK